MQNIIIHYVEIGKGSHNDRLVKNARELLEDPEVAEIYFGAGSMARAS